MRYVLIPPLKVPVEELRRVTKEVEDWLAKEDRRPLLCLPPGWKLEGFLELKPEQNDVQSPDPEA